MKRSKTVTIYDIAEHTQLSVSTVSRALRKTGYISADAVEKVERAVQELGYRAKGRAAAADRPKVILVNIPILHNPFYNELLNGIRASAGTRGYSVLVNQDYLTAESAGDTAELLEAIGAVGFLTTNYMTKEAEAQLLHTVPVVQCSEYNAESVFPYVGVDDVQAGRSVTEHLIKMGGTRLALINGPDRFKYARDRKKGFLEAARQAGLEVSEEYIIDLPELEFNMAYSVAEQLLLMPERPDALFTVSDVVATASLRAAQKLELHVPEDLIIAGFDNTEPSLMSSPSLTTVDMPKYQIGFTACEMLIKQIEHPELNQRSIILKTDLVIRESTMPGMRN